MRLLQLAGIALTLGLVGCSAMNTARPLKEGQHAVGLTFGGATVAYEVSPSLEQPEGDILNIPLPIAIIEGRSGLPKLYGKDVDVQYGLNLTALQYDMIGLQTGVTMLLAEQRGYRPAWSVHDRLYFYNNWFSNSRTEESQSWWAATQLETTISWKLRGQLFYMGVAETLDFKLPSLLLSPFCGMELIRSGRTPGFGLQLELRHFAINKKADIEIIDWVEPLGQGALGMFIGMNYKFKRRGKK